MVILVIIGLPYVFKDKFVDKIKKETSWRDEKDPLMAYIMVKDYIREILGNTDVEFPGVLERDDHTKYIGNQKYVITSFFREHSLIYGTIIYKFEGEIEQVSKHEWQIKNMETKQWK